MQVRKFEAKTMKEALDLVKQHLGPEAIILSAKDNSRGFGLMGEKSVEVTAAVSDETLRRKRSAETRMKDSEREKFTRSPARAQKQFIQRSYDQREAAATAAANRSSAPAPAPARPTPTFQAQRYIDIDDEEMRAPTSSQRIKDAALRARSIGQVMLTEPIATPAKPAPKPPVKTQDVAALEAQIGELKTMLEKFQRVPQNMLSQHPGAEEGLPYELTGAFQRLRQEGVETAITVEWLKNAKADMDRDQLKKPSLIDAWLVQKILRETAVAKDPFASRYHCFLGTTGQGKTTSLVKLASHFVLKERKRIALVSLDTVKVGATDQLKIYAQILNVPFAVVRHPDDWKLLEEKVKDVHHVLVDAPGMNLKTMEEVEWLKQLLPTGQRKLHFVQSALARDEECFEIASRYRMIGFDDVIFTRLDESVQHGLVINFQKQFQTQLHSFGTGPQVPEDFELATKERVADLIFKISKIKRREVSL